jgi:hypothetical protein
MPVLYITRSLSSFVRDLLFFQARDFFGLFLWLDGGVDYCANQKLIIVLSISYPMKILTMAGKMGYKKAGRPFSNLGHILKQPAFRPLSFQKPLHLLTAFTTRMVPLIQGGMDHAVEVDPEVSYSPTYSGELPFYTMALCNLFVTRLLLKRSLVVTTLGKITNTSLIR